MVQFCCVTGCGNRSNREQKQFYRLPNISKLCDRASYKADIILRRRKQWLLNIGRADLKDGDEAYSPGYIRVCSDHFVSGKPSVWSDVDNIDWAPTVQMGCGKDLSISQRKKPHKNTAQKRAMRIQELQKKKMLLGLVSDTKQSKMVEQKGGEKKTADTQVPKTKGTSSGQSGSTKQKGKKIAAKGKKVQNKGLKVKKKRGKATRKQVKAPKEEPEQYSKEIQRMLKKQEIKVRRKILELELTGGKQSTPNDRLMMNPTTINPIIHRITMESVVLSPEDDIKIKVEPTSSNKIEELCCMPEVPVEKGLVKDEVDVVKKEDVN